MNWKQLLGLSLTALIVALVAYGQLFAKPRWIEIKVERTASVIL